VTDFELAGRFDEPREFEPRRGEPEPSARTAVAAGQLPQRWTDCHSHLPTSGGLSSVCARATDARVMRLVDVGRDVSSSCEAALVAARTEGVWSTAGVAPDRAGDGFDAAGNVDLAAIELLLFEPHVVGVGECGLHYDEANLDAAHQRELLAAHVALANAYDKVLVIHTTDAWDDLFDVVKGERVPDRVVVSPFTGGADEARRALNMGMHLSFNGLLGREDGTELREIAARCPLDRIVLEAGSTPSSSRLTSVGPWWVAKIGRTLSEVIDRHITETALITWSNSRELFGLR
jgi:TatD DNase family protein